MAERLLAFDPGDPHVGVSLWHRPDGGRWECLKAKEMTPDQFADLIFDVTANGRITAMAYEIFRLGGGQEALRQQGSTFGTVELIGLARHHARWASIDFQGFERGNRASALKRMKAVRWQFPRGCSDHVRDACAVGACYTRWTANDHFDGDGVRTA